MPIDMSTNCVAILRNGNSISARVYRQGIIKCSMSIDMSTVSVGILQNGNSVSAHVYRHGLIKRSMSIDTSRNGVAAFCKMATQLVPMSKNMGS